MHQERIGQGKKNATGMYRYLSGKHDNGSARQAIIKPIAPSSTIYARLPYLAIGGSVVLLCGITIS